MSPARFCPTARSPTTPVSRSARLRREIEKQKKSIHDSLERFLRAHKEEGVLQEEIVTIRNERFVVPVISGPAQEDRRRHSRREFERPHAVRRAARDHRSQQRSGAAHRRRAARIAPRAARNQRAAARLCGSDPAGAGHDGRARAAVHQSALRSRVRLRHSKVRNEAAVARGPASAACRTCSAANGRPSCRSRSNSTPSAARC